MTAATSPGRPAATASRLWLAPGLAVAGDGMNVRHHRCYPVESGFVPGPPWADYGVADAQAGQLGQVIQDAGLVFVGLDKGGHRLLDRIVVAAGILTMRAKDVELVLQ